MTYNVFGGMLNPTLLLLFVLLICKMLLLPLALYDSRIIEKVMNEFHEIFGRGRSLDREQLINQIACFLSTFAKLQHYVSGEGQK